MMPIYGTHFPGYKLSYLIIPKTLILLSSGGYETFSTKLTPPPRFTSLKNVERKSLKKEKQTSEVTGLSMVIYLCYLLSGGPP